MNDSTSGDNTVVDFKAAAEKKRSSYEYVEVYNLLGSKWMRLPPAQLAVMMFVNLRTRKYGKASERIPNKHFTEGVTSAEGNVITTGLSMSRKTIYTAVRGLEELGILKVWRARSRCKNCVNKFEIDFKMLQQGPDEMASKLRIPKKERGGVKITHGGGKNYPRVVQNLPVEETDSNKQISNKQKHGGRSAPTRHDSLEEAVETAKAMSRSKRKSKAASVTKRVTQQGIKALWEDLMTEHYPHVPYAPLTQKQYAIFKRNLDSLKLRSTSITDVLEWIIVNWRGVTGGSLSWIAKKEPNLSLPTLNVVAKYLRYFVDAYGDSRAVLSKPKRIAPEQRPEGDSSAEVKRLRRKLAESEKRYDGAAKRLYDINRAQKKEKESAPTGLVEIGGIDYASMTIESAKDE